MWFGINNGVCDSPLVWSASPPYEDSPFALERKIPSVDPNLHFCGTKKGQHKESNLADPWLTITHNIDEESSKYNDRILNK